VASARDRAVDPRAVGELVLTCAPNCAPTGAETGSLGGATRRVPSAEWLFSRINAARDLLTDWVRFSAPPPFSSRNCGVCPQHRDL